MRIPDFVDIAEKLQKLEQLRLEKEKVEKFAMIPGAGASVGGTLGGLIGGATGGVIGGAVGGVLLPVGIYVGIVKGIPFLKKKLEERKKSKGKKDDEDKDKDKKKKYYKDLEDLPGVGEVTAEKLRAAG